MKDKERESKYDTFRRLGFEDYEIYAMVLGDANEILEFTRPHVKWPELAKKANGFQAGLYLKAITGEETGGNLRYSEVVAELKKYEQQDSTGTVRKIREMVEVGFSALEKALSNRAA